MRGFVFDQGEERERTFAPPKLTPAQYRLPAVGHTAGGKLVPRAGEVQLRDLQAKLPQLPAKLLSQLPQRTLLVYANVRPAQGRRPKDGSASQQQRGRDVDLPTVGASSLAAKAAKASTWPAAAPSDAAPPPQRPHAVTAAAAELAAARAGGPAHSRSSGPGEATLAGLSDRQLREAARVYGPRGSGVGASPARGGHGSVSPLRQRAGAAGAQQQPVGGQRGAGAGASAGGRSPLKQRVRPRSGRGKRFVPLARLAASGVSGHGGLAVAGEAAPQIASTGHAAGGAGHHGRAAKGAPHPRAGDAAAMLHTPTKLASKAGANHAAAVPGSAAATIVGAAAAERAGDATASSSTGGDQPLLKGRYLVDRVVGEGAYGVVLKCQDVKTGATVALKQFKISGPDAEDVRRISTREVTMLRKLNHPNIVGFIDEFSDESQSKVYVVMEFVPRNLLEVLEESGGGLPKDLVQSIVRQMVAAVGFLHDSAIVFRDVKPENVLIDDARREGGVKLCDFGFARKFKPTDVLTEYVATRWYRAPELLMGPPFTEAGAEVRPSYGPPADMWAIGCIIGELVDCEPMFPGESDIDQLHRIMLARGPLLPSQLSHYNANPHHKDARITSDTAADANGLQQRYGGKMTEVELSFMAQLLDMDPEQRPTAREALELPWLKAV